MRQYSSVGVCACAVYEALRPRPGLGSSDTRPRCSATMGTAGVAAPRRGKAPPVDSFTAENKEIRLDDWLPTLDRAATWNGWSEGRLIQLAGHLRGRALQEWGLLCSEDKATFTLAVEALRSRLDTDNKALAAQDFRHPAKARQKVKTKAREAPLYGQLHAGLKYELMKSSTVSGAQLYKQLCVCAKTEEKRLIGLKRRQSYLRDGQHSRKSLGRDCQEDQSPVSQPASGQRAGQLTCERRCYTCSRTGHLARDCTQTKKESTGKLETTGWKSVPGARTKMVTTEMDPWDLLYSSDSEGGVHQVRVEDEGSCPAKQQ